MRERSRRARRQCGSNSWHSSTFEGQIYPRAWGISFQSSRREKKEKEELCRHIPIENW